VAQRVVGRPREQRIAPEAADRPVTARASLERLRASRLPRVLFVSHAGGGGVARHIGELAAAIAGDAEVLLLQPHLTASLVLRWLRPGEDLALWMRKDEEWERMVALLESIGIDRVHFHHVHGLPPAVLALPRLLGCPHDFTLHDYYPACPAYHLADGSGRFCGGAPDCQRCLEARPAQWPMSIDTWRAAFAGVLDHAERVIAPSEDAARRIAAFFPGARVVTWPHPEAAVPDAAVPWRVLVPGAISPAKGLEVLEACVRDAAARALPLHFRVLGFTARPIGAWPALPCGLTGEYRESDLAELIALERGDAFFFPAQVPETFSYTLSAALATGLPIVATDLGAFPGRLAGRDGAHIVRRDATAAEMNDAILAAIGRIAAATGVAVHRVAPSEYRARYVEGLARISSPGTPPELEPRWLDAPTEAVTLSSLAWLFDDGVRAGRGSSLEELRRRAAEADARMERDAAELARGEQALRAARGEAEQARAEAARALGERDAAAGDAHELHARLGTIERSRSWRLTAPLRALMRLLRPRV
jgi:glycosyltransferase involved in cell wall biosynthesis